MTRQVGLDDAYREACQALGEATVMQRLLATETTNLTTETTNLTAENAALKEQLAAHLTVSCSGCGMSDEPHCHYHERFVVDYGPADADGCRRDPPPVAST